MSRALRHLCAALSLAVLAALATPAGAQQQDNPAPVVDLDWTPWLSEFPQVDLTGTWVFDAATSDVMVEAWRDREVLYVVDQQMDRIVFDFSPEDGQRNVQGYRWNGSVSEFERGTAEVRERARWTGGGRIFEVEGRWWPTENTAEVTKYTFLYRLEGLDRLALTQRDEHGETVWRFHRRR